MRRLHPVLFILLLARSAVATDGVIEINAVSAAAGGITPGDAPGYPVTLAVTGSYRLTGNLRLVGAQEAIRVTADDVTLDLNGFEISCRTPTIPSGPCSNTPGSQNGLVLNGDNVRVENGTIRGMAASGVFAGFDSSFSLDRLRVIDNGAHGLRSINSRGEVSDSVFRDNHDDGLHFERVSGFHSYSVERVRAFDNGSNGLWANGFSAGQVSHSRFEGNTIAGLQFDGDLCGALVSHTVTRGNSSGILASQDCQVAIDSVLSADGTLSGPGIEVIGCSTYFSTLGFVWQTICP